MKKLIGALILALASIGLTAVAYAHTATFGADCDGVTIHAVSYDGSRDNRWAVTVGNVTQTGTFDDSYDGTFPVPQGGATTDWSAMIEAEDGGYHFTDSGQVGPCGTTPPPPVVKHAWFRVMAYCNVVHVEGRHNVASIEHRHSKARKHVFVGHAKPGALFGNGKATLRKVAWSKRHCGSGS